MRWVDRMIQENHFFEKTEAGTIRFFTAAQLRNSLVWLAACATILLFVFSSRAHFSEILIVYGLAAVITLLPGFRLSKKEARMKKLTMFINWNFTLTNWLKRMKDVDRKHFQDYYETGFYDQKFLNYVLVMQAFGNLVLSFFIILFTAFNFVGSLILIADQSGLLVVFPCVACFYFFLSLIRSLPYFWPHFAFQLANNRMESLSFTAATGDDQLSISLRLKRFSISFAYSIISILVISAVLLFIVVLVIYSRSSGGDYMAFVLAAFLMSSGLLIRVFRPSRKQYLQSLRGLLRVERYFPAIFNSLVLHYVYNDPGAFLGFRKIKSGKHYWRVP